MAVAIDDPAPARRDHRIVDAVAFGKQLVMLVLGDRQPGHPPGEDDAHRGLRAAEHHRPPAEAEVLLRLVARARGLGHARRRTRSSRTTSRAIKGNTRIDTRICKARLVSTCAAIGEARARPASKTKPIAPAAISQSCQKSRKTRRISTSRAQARRVGKACVSTCRSRWSSNHKNKTDTTKQSNKELPEYSQIIN